MSVLERIREHHLQGQGIVYREVHHAPTFTSEESARALGKVSRPIGRE